MLGHGEPIRVKRGQRLLFHILNGSATEIRSLTLPGHAFEVVALDGNPVPTPVKVPVLWLGTAERISAVVEMNHPGVWVLGDLETTTDGTGWGSWWNTHRHSIELTRVGGKATAGILKDVVMLGGYQETEIDFVADNPGLTLFHCHQQLHMDFGFMTLFDYSAS
jgi:FtsP/CotA-like multicopper oxidase with cupredoxin domain